jgi:hypothetical protein
MTAIENLPPDERDLWEGYSAEQQVAQYDDLSLPACFVLAQRDTYGKHTLSRIWRIWAISFWKTSKTLR